MLPAYVTLAMHPTASRKAHTCEQLPRPGPPSVPSWSSLGHPSYLNLGIVAHVDAGKTSLTERLLYDAGVIDAPGSVDAGTTRTDSMDLERRRGITIRAAVTSFALGDLAVNLVDTPGHPDFIAEVERSLTVLDAAVLVLSAVEGVQPQTVVIWRALRRIGVPTALFVNKVDRGGADVAAVVAQVRRRLTAHVVRLARPVAEGRPGREVVPVPLHDASVVEAVAEIDDGVLAGWVDGEPVPADRIRAALRRGIREGTLTPLLCGSALTGAGIPLLRDLVHDCCPSPRTRRRRVRHRVRGRPRRAGPPRLAPAVVGRGHGARPAADRGHRSPRSRDRGRRQRTGRHRDPADGDGRPDRRAPRTPGTDRGHPRTPAPAPDPPVPAGHGPGTGRARGPEQRGALFAGLSELAEEDPLIDLRIDAAEREAALSLHGEVQKEVVAALLEERYGVRARFSRISTLCIERVAGTGSSRDLIGQRGNPYLAGLGLRVEAAPVGHGVEFSPGVERGNLPPAFVAATEEGVRSGLRQGLHGWEVTDCVVTMTASAYFPRQSRPHQKFDKSVSTVAGDFRHLAPVVLTAALREARTTVCQPIDRFELDLPEQAHAPVAALLGRLGAVVLEATGSLGYARLVGELPTARLPGLASRLPDLTRGEAVLVTQFDHYAPVTGEEPPSARRRGPDPADREAWFREVPR